MLAATTCCCGRVHAVRTANRIILQRIENDFLWALNGQLGAMLSVLALASNGLSVHELASISDVDVLYVLAIVQIAPHILTGAPPQAASATRLLWLASRFSGTRVVNGASTCKRPPLMRFVCIYVHAPPLLPFAERSRFTAAFRGQWHHCIRTP